VLEILDIVNVLSSAASLGLQYVFKTHTRYHIESINMEGQLLKMICSIVIHTMLFYNISNLTYELGLYYLGSNRTVV
jgi:hypothetical protein